MTAGCSGAVRGAGARRALSVLGIQTGANVYPTLRPVIYRPSSFVAGMPVDRCIVLSSVPAVVLGAALEFRCVFESRSGDAVAGSWTLVNICFAPLKASAKA